jgi:histidine triad (HIT) family protein
MFNHQPEGWTCPFCRLLAGDDSGLNSQADLVCRTGRASALVAPHWYPNNPGPVLVVPDVHIENLYDLPSIDGHAVHDLVRQVAVAMRRSYDCDGVSTRQHNEPAGDQDVWHYHVHVFPRHRNDDLYGSARNKEAATREDRAAYAAKLRAALP